MLFWLLNCINNGTNFYASDAHFDNQYLFSAGRGQIIWKTNQSLHKSLITINKIRIFIATGCAGDRYPRVLSVHQKCFLFKCLMGRTVHIVYGCICFVCSILVSISYIRIQNLSRLLHIYTWIWAEDFGIGQWENNIRNQ